jgi:hypothetical protein
MLRKLGFSNCFLLALGIAFAIVLGADKIKAQIMSAPAGLYIYVGDSIDELGDVNTTGRTGGHCLVYNGGSQRWEAATCPGGGEAGESTLQVSVGGVEVSSPTATLNFTAPFTATQSPVGTANIGVDGSSVTLQGNVFNAANRLLRLDGSGLIPNALIDGSVVTKLGPSIALGSETTGDYVQSLTAGTAITVGASGVAAQPVVAFNPAGLTGNRTFAAGATGTITWAWDVIGTDPSLSFTNNTITTPNNVNINGTLLINNKLPCLEDGTNCLVSDDDPIGEVMWDGDRIVLEAKAFNFLSPFEVFHVGVATAMVKLNDDFVDKVAAATPLSVATGTGSGFDSVAVSTTHVLVFDEALFTAQLLGTNTAYITLVEDYLTTSSATATYLQEVTIDDLPLHGYAHAAGEIDEIEVTGLSGVLADPQRVALSTGTSVMAVSTLTAVTGSGGIATSIAQHASSATITIDGSGIVGSGGSSVYPATATASFPYGLSASTLAFTDASLLDGAGDTKFLTTDASGNVYLADPPGGGEANTASNIGTGDGEVFAQKAALDLEFRTLAAGDNVSIQTHTSTVSFSVSFDTLLSTTAAASTYLTQSSATATYLQEVPDLSGTYLTTSSATATYLQAETDPHAILNQNTLQSGATFYVEKGTALDFYASTATITAIEATAIVLSPPRLFGTKGLPAGDGSTGAHVAEADVPGAQFAAWDDYDKFEAYIALVDGGFSGTLYVQATILGLDYDPGGDSAFVTLSTPGRPPIADSCFAEVVAKTEIAAATAEFGWLSAVFTWPGLSFIEGLGVGLSEFDGAAISIGVYTDAGATTPAAITESMGFLDTGAGTIDSWHGCEQTRYFSWPLVYGDEGQLMATTAEGQLYFTDFDAVLNQDTLQAGTTFHVGKGTIEGVFRVDARDSSEYVTLSHSAPSPVTGQVVTTLHNRKVPTYGGAAIGAFVVSASTAASAPGEAEIRITPGLTGPGKVEIRSGNADVLSANSSTGVFMTTATVAGAFTATGLSYPTSDGSAGQFLKTDGSGTLSFDTPAGSGDAVLSGTQTWTGSNIYTSTAGIQLPWLASKDCIGTDADGNVVEGTGTGGTGGSGYAVEPATVTFQLDHGFTASTGSVTGILSVSTVTATTLRLSESAFLRYSDDAGTFWGESAAGRMEFGTPGNVLAFYTDMDEDAGGTWSPYIAIDGGRILLSNNAFGDASARLVIVEIDKGVTSGAHEQLSIRKSNFNDENILAFGYIADGDAYTDAYMEALDGKGLVLRTGGGEALSIDATRKIFVSTVAIANVLELPSLLDGDGDDKFLTTDASGNVILKDAPAGGSGGGGYDVEPATVTFQMDHGFTASTGTFTGNVNIGDNDILNVGRIRVGATGTPSNPFDYRGATEDFFRIDRASMGSDYDRWMAFYKDSAKKGSFGFRTNTDSFEFRNGQNIGKARIDVNRGNAVFGSTQTASGAGTAAFVDGILVVGTGEGARPGPTDGISSKGSIYIRDQNALRFYDSDSSNYVSLAASATVAANVAFTLPAADGSAGQAMVTDGSGNLSFATVEGGATISTFSVTVPISAASLAPTITNGFSGGVQTGETETNKVNYDFVSLSSSTTNYFQFSYSMPQGWDGSTVTFSPVWISTGGTGDVSFALQALGRGDNTEIDTAYGAPVIVTDTLQNTDRVHIGPESGALTIGGSPSPGDYITWRGYRAWAEASDTLDNNVQLLEIRIRFTRSQLSD